MVTNSMEKYKAEEEGKMIIYLSNPVYTDCPCLNFSSAFDYLSFIFPLDAETSFCLGFPTICL